MQQTPRRRCWFQPIVIGAGSLMRSVRLPPRTAVRTQILPHPPISGTYPERRYDAMGPCTWVLFNNEAGNEWVGVFGSTGLANFSAAIAFGDDLGRTVLVIARGQGYVVDAVTGALIRKTPWDYSYAALTVLERDFVVVADVCEIWATYRDRDVPAVPAEGHFAGDPNRVALDGILFDEATRDELTGKLWDGGGWYSFRLHLDSMRVERGSQLPEE